MPPKDLGPEPKKACSAYTFFNTEYTKKLRVDDTELKVTDCFKLAGEKWGTMSESEKAPYSKMNEADKARVEKQSAERQKKGFFLMPDGSKSTDEKNKKLFKVKKPKVVVEEEDAEEAVLLPKRPTSAYSYFATECMKQMRENATEGEHGNTDFMKMAGAKWSTLEDKDKVPYEKLAVKDKERCDKQKAEVEKKGYFVLDDGTKSTDEKNIPKKKVKRSLKRQMVSESEEELVPPKKRKSLKKLTQELDVEEDDQPAKGKGFVKKQK